MKLRRIFRKKREDFYSAPDSDVTQEVPNVETVQEPVDTEEKHLSKDALSMWYKLFCDEDYSELKNLDWNDVQVADIVHAFKNQINSSVSSLDYKVRVSYIGYLATYSVNLYNMARKSAWNYRSLKDYYPFISKIIQALYDTCIVHNVSFYDVFVEVKDLPLRKISVRNEITEYKFNYSFSLFTSLWENSTSKCFFDKKDKHIEAITYIFQDYFEEFLENADAKDIEALHQFFIRNKDLIKENYVEKISYAITDEFYEAGTYITTEAAIAIGENEEYLLVPAYINCLNGIMYQMQRARETQDYILIDLYEEKMCDIIMRIRMYQEYRSEDFREYFETNWEWLLSTMLNYFSGHVITIFSDLIQEFYGAKEEEIEYVILTHVYSITLDYESGECASMDEFGFNEVYRLLSNKVAFEAIDSVNPALINAF